MKLMIMSRYEWEAIMNGKVRYLSTIPFLGCIVMVTFIGCIFSVPVADATVTVQSVSGTVKVLLEKEPVWKPLTEKVQLRAGDQVMTEAGASVDLLLEDGSELHLGEETQLAISELEFSMAEKTRISRFKLFWGALTAKAAKFAFKKNVFEVETDTVVAGMKFSKMKVVSKKDDTRPDEVTALEGGTYIKQTGPGGFTGRGHIDDQEGLEFFINSVGATIDLGVQRIIRKITLEGNVPLPSIRALIGGNDNILKVNNASDEPLRANFKGIVATLDRQETATFGISPDQEIIIEANPNAEFWSQQGPLPPCDGLYVFADKGPIDVNGQVIDTGSFKCFPIEPSPFVEQEEPVEPPAPARLQPEGAGSPIQPQ
jgi:hypothetical protein